MTSETHLYLSRYYQVKKPRPNGHRTRGTKAALADHRATGTKAAHADHRARGTKAAAQAKNLCVLTGIESNLN